MLWPARGMQAVPGTGFFTLGSNEWLGHKVFGGHADTTYVFGQEIGRPQAPVLGFSVRRQTESVKKHQETHVFENEINNLTKESLHA